MSDTPAAATAQAEAADRLTPLARVDQRIAHHRRALAAGKQRLEAFFRKLVAMQGALQELEQLKAILTADDPQP